MEDLIAYLDRHGIPYTIDKNPSPEKIKRIKRSIQRRKNMEKFFRDRYSSG